MKLIQTPALILTLALSFLQAEETLPPDTFGIKHSWFAGPVLKYTRLNSQHGLMAGGRASYLFNSVLGIGAGGYTKFNTMASDNDFKIEKKSDGRDTTVLDNINGKLGFSYGGLILDWIFVPEEVIHGGFSLLLGKGIMNAENGNSGFDDFYVMEPEWFFEGNISSFLRFDLSLGWRWLIGGDKYVNKFWERSGITTSVMIKFGKFYVEP